MTYIENELYEKQKEYVNVLRYMLEKDMNAFYDAQAKYNETQLKFARELSRLNQMKEEIAGTGSL